MKRILGKQPRSRLSSLLLILMLVGIWRVFDRRPRQRVASQEAVEDPEVAAAFEWVTRMPQMRWIRHYVSSHAAAMQGQGEAVDLGCGAGQLVIELAQSTPGLHLTGIDLSDSLLTEARHAALLAGLEKRVEFRLGNVEDIPFPDQSLDLVVSTASLHHWKDPLRVFNEVGRVLKPDGAYYIFDLRRDVALPFYLLFWFATQFVVPAALHQANEPMNSRNASYTADELLNLARQSALSGGEVIPGPLWLVLAGKKA